MMQQRISNLIRKVLVDPIIDRDTGDEDEKYRSNYGKQRSKPRDKMRRRHEDK